MRSILIDPRTGGISGDMLSAALVNLTGSADSLYRVADAIRALPCCPVFDISVRETENGIRATRMFITIREGRAGSGCELAGALDEVIDRVGLSAPAAAKARATLSDLVAAEERLHASGFSRHAVASADTIFDILAPFAILEDAGLSGCPVYATPPALGGGTIRTGSGEVGGPAPAALEICARHRIPVSESPLAMELTTPTGAALLANIAGVVTRFPAMTPLRIGYGSGTRKNGSGLNILRVVEGETGNLVEEEIVILETNIDDVTGEVIAYTGSRLFAAGAVDVFVTPAFGKKNRPVHIVSVITDRDHYRELIGILMDETGTLGVRVRSEPRLVADRNNETVFVTVAGRAFPVRVKTSSVDNRNIAVKPEYEDMSRIARELGLPLRRVAGEVYRQLPHLRTGDSQEPEKGDEKTRESE